MREAAAEEGREEATDDLTQNGHTNGQEVETHSQQREEEEEDTYQKEETVFTADEGTSVISLPLSFFFGKQKSATIFSVLCLYVSTCYHSSMAPCTLESSE